MSTGTYLDFILALVFVIGLICLTAWAYRRFLMGRTFAGRFATRFGGPAARLQVVEVRAIDARRRLVLVRRDAVEHLLLLGATAETVVETGIVPTGAPGAEAGR